MRRLLFLLPFAPRLDANHGGSRTIGQLLAALGGRHRLAVIYLRGEDEPGMDDALRACCDAVEEVPRRRKEGSRRIGETARGMLALLRGTPPWVAECAVPSYGTRLRALADRWRPDLVQVEFHVMGQHLAALGHHPAPRILVQHDRGATAARSGVPRDRWPGTLATDLEIRAWGRYERAIMRQVQAVVVFTEPDRLAVERQAPGVRVERIPIGTTLPARPLDPLGHGPPSILFVGSFRHPPNTDAASRLISGILPRLQEQFPELVLYVVGDAPPPVLRDTRAANVIVTGRVPDVRPYLDRAAVVVAPLRRGGGMRVKVLESLAAGKAIVASPLAAAGLEVAHGEHILLADTDDQFCDAIGGLLRNSAQRLALAGRARIWACDHLGWEPVVTAYERLYASLIR